MRKLGFKNVSAILISEIFHALEVFVKNIGKLLTITAIFLKCLKRFGAI